MLKDIANGCVKLIRIIDLNKNCIIMEIACRGIPIPIVWNTNTKKIETAYKWSWVNNRKIHEDYAAYVKQFFDGVNYNDQNDINQRVKNILFRMFVEIKTLGRLKGIDKKSDCLPFMTDQKGKWKKIDKKLKLININLPDTLFTDYILDKMPYMEELVKGKL